MYKFKFADIAEGLEEGKVLEIFVKENQEVEEGDDLFSVETEKVNTEIGAPIDGTINKILMKKGEVIKVGQVIMEIAPKDKTITEDIEVNDKAKEKETLSKEGASVVGDVPISDDLLPSRSLSSQTISSESNFVNTDIKCTPLVRKMASDLKVNLSKIKGTGPNNRIIKNDILSYQNINSNNDLASLQKTVLTQPKKSTPPPLPSWSPNFVPAERTTTTKLVGIRKAIANHMALAKSTIPETTLMREVDITNLINLRADLKEEAANRGIKLTFMAFFIKAVAIALKKFPIINSSLINDEIIQKNYYNIGIAVDSPYGLMVPVIKNADQKGILRLASEVIDYARKVRTRNIDNKEMNDGTFTISNYGSVGLEFATPVINYPEAAILGIGLASKKPIVDKEDQIKVGNILPLSLTIDHRIIDGADGGRFLQAIIELLQDPDKLLLY